MSDDVMIKMMPAIPLDDLCMITRRMLEWDKMPPSTRGDYYEYILEEFPELFLVERNGVRYAVGLPFFNIIPVTNLINTFQTTVRGNLDPSASYEEYIQSIIDNKDLLLERGVYVELS